MESAYKVHVTIASPLPVAESSQSVLRNADYKDMFDLYRGQMEHEDTLVNHRITFSSVIQTALVTSFVFADRFVDPNSALSIRKGLCIVGSGMTRE